MLEVTTRAASVIANECQRRDLPDTSGVRIYPRPAAKDVSVRALGVEFVREPRDDDTVIRQDDAAVFLAAGIEHLVVARQLDAEPEGTAPRLMLRKQENGAPQT
jgi:Fe-S cluster assembly iron-binding protein IscA